MSEMGTTITVASLRETIQARMDFQHRIFTDMTGHRIDDNAEAYVQPADLRAAFALGQYKGLEWLLGQLAP